MKHASFVLATVLATPAVVSSDASPTVPLVWHVESGAGESLASNDADVPVNPASVVKVATTLWALERLGPEHRFETAFTTRGTLDPRTGVLQGDLLVHGSGDPDFHVENAYLVAGALNEAGLRIVSGSLLVDGAFWIGWEGGSAKRHRSLRRREETMAARLRDALDPGRWSPRTRRLIEEFRERSGVADALPGVVVRGSVGTHSTALPELGPFLLHRSNPLHVILKRFNAFSNNDIERLGRSLGTPADLALALRKRFATDSSAVQLETLSGLGVNRMSARTVVRLLRELDAACRRLGLRLEDVLPANGCDPGTLKHFPGLADGVSGSVVAKTGTLVQTDDGVAVLAGRARTAEGDRFFCVAAPRAGKNLARARAAADRWLLDLIERHGGPQAGNCGAQVAHSDDHVILSGGSELD